MCVCVSVCVCLVKKAAHISTHVRWFLVETGQGHTGNEPNKTQLPSATGYVDTHAHKQNLKANTLKLLFFPFILSFMCERLEVINLQVCKKRVIGLHTCAHVEERPGCTIATCFLCTDSFFSLFTVCSHLEFNFILNSYIEATANKLVTRYHVFLQGCRMKNVKMTSNFIQHKS